jgi:hypothetical protein
LWAIRINEHDQVIWKKIFETKAGPLFFGDIFRGGSTVMMKYNTNSTSIVKIDSRGNVLFWKHYALGGRILGISEAPDEGIILVSTSNQFLKLDNEGSIVWKKTMPANDPYPQYALEASDGSILLILGSRDHGILVSRLRIEEPFPDCDILQFEEPTIGEHFPLLPANIGGSVEVTHDLSVRDVLDVPLTLNESTPQYLEICRYVVPIPIPTQPTTP